MKRFFPQLNEIDLNKLQIDNIGEYSITRPEEASLISEIIIKENNPEETILDAMAGIGGNSISFCNNFKNVVNTK